MKRDRKNRVNWSIIITSLILALALAGCGGLLGLEESPVEDFEYVYDADTQGVMITYYMDTDTKVVIPRMIEGEPVTSISGVVLSRIEFYGAFEDSGIMSVHIPDTVKVIDMSAFEGCTGLTSVTIPDSVTAIGYRAFWDCDNLPEETRQKIQDIDSRAFAE